MSYRGYQNARINARRPEALGVCDRCGKITNHNRLFWQYDYFGPKLANERILVCETCSDKPFEQNRTIIIPPDPVPILNARPEPYFADDNPVSPIGWDALRNVPSGGTLNGNLGNMTNGAGIDAPFRGALSKPQGLSALAKVSSSSFNYVGKNWTAYLYPPSAVPGFTVPAGTFATTYALASFTAQAPFDSAFLDTGPASLEVDGWNGSSWVPIWTGTSSGSKGEVLTGTIGSQTQYYAHRLCIVGDGVHPAAIGSLQFFASGDAQRTDAPPTQPS